METYRKKAYLLWLLAAGLMVLSVYFGYYGQVGMSTLSKNYCLWLAGGIVLSCFAIMAGIFFYDASREEVKKASKSEEYKRLLEYSKRKQK